MYDEGGRERQREERGGGGYFRPPPRPLCSLCPAPSPRLLSPRSNARCSPPCHPLLCAPLALGNGSPSMYFTIQWQPRALEAETGLSLKKRKETTRRGGSSEVQRETTQTARATIITTSCSPPRLLVRRRAVSHALLPRRRRIHPCPPRCCRAVSHTLCVHFSHILCSKLLEGVVHEHSIN